MTEGRDEKAPEPGSSRRSKAVEWAVAVALMAILAGFLVGFIYYMRGLR